MEKWKEIIGYEGRYQISSFGHVKSINGWGGINEKILQNTSRGKTGYLSVVLCLNGKRKTKNIHTLLAQAFIPNHENKKQVNHKDGNKQNNELENLEWCTPSENHQHALKTGLIMNIRHGDGHHYSKLNSKIVKFIRSSPLSNKQLAKRFEVSPQTIYRVRYGKTWRN